jgi:hypothetical protein
MFTMVTQEVNRESGGAQKPQSFSSLSEIFRFTDVPKTASEPDKPVKPEEVKEEPKKETPPKPR